MKENILQKKRECFITGDTLELHRHHVYGGSRRKASEAWGCWVWLRADWHNLANYGVHTNKELDIWLKRLYQERFEELHGHEKFMAVFGKNYL